MEKQPKRTEGRIAQTNFDKSELCKAVMDQDVGRIRDMCRKYGSNCPIETNDGLVDCFLRKKISSFPLHLAASNRRLQSMRSLLKAGADVELCDQLGRNPLHLALNSWPNIDCGGSDPDSKYHRVVKDRRRQAEACLRLLCEHGVDVNVKMMSGNTHERALHMAARSQALPVVRILTQHGADVHVLDHSGMTPLHAAAAQSHTGILKCLISHGAQVNQRMQDSGNTPLHIAIVILSNKTDEYQEARAGFISAMFECGADPNIGNNDGLTPMQLACLMGMHKILDMLLENGVDINKPTQAGENGLFLFLKHRPSVKMNSMFVKLLGLVSPLSIYDQKGQLPPALTEQRFSRQRDQLLRLTQQPKRLKDICKTVIYLKYVQGKKDELRSILPRKLYDFVFNEWDNTHNINFDTDKREV
ncbi:unnamed protein product [Ophioblennius macclurei]